MPHACFVQRGLLSPLSRVAELSRPNRNPDPDPFLNPNSNPNPNPNPDPPSLLTLTLTLTLTLSRPFAAAARRAGTDKVSPNRLGGHTYDRLYQAHCTEA